jgi:hypothetical protein
VRWLLARRVGSGEADQFFEELDELHAIRRETEGAESGDRWMRRELRKALLSGLGRRVLESGVEESSGNRSPRIGRDGRASRQRQHLRSWRASD